MLGWSILQSRTEHGTKGGSVKEIKSIDELYKIYFPKGSKRYPFTMRVSEAEQRLILKRRGVWIEEET